MPQEKVLHNDGIIGIVLKEQEGKTARRSRRLRKTHFVQDPDLLTYTVYNACNQHQYHTCIRTFRMFTDMMCVHAPEPLVLRTNQCYDIYIGRSFVLLKTRGGNLPGIGTNVILVI